MTFAAERPCGRFAAFWEQIAFPARLKWRFPPQPYKNVRLEAKM